MESFTSRHREPAIDYGSALRGGSQALGLQKSRYQVSRRGSVAFNKMVPRRGMLSKTLSVGETPRCAQITIANDRQSGSGWRYYDTRSLCTFRRSYAMVLKYVILYYLLRRYKITPPARKARIEDAILVRVLDSTCVR